MGVSYVDPNKPDSYIFDFPAVEHEKYIPGFTHVCSHCYALRMKFKTYDTCCRSETCQLPRQYFKKPNVPAVLEVFIDKLWPKYSYLVNKCLSFAMNATNITTDDSRNGKRCIILNGQVSAFTSGVIPDPNFVDADAQPIPRFSEIWTMSSNEASRERHLQLLDTIKNRIPRSSMPLADLEKVKWFVRVLHDYIQENNYYAKKLNSAKEVLESSYTEEEISDSALYYRAVDPINVRDSRTHNLPQLDEVSIAYKPDRARKDLIFIVNTRNNNSLEHISIIHPMFLLLWFPVLFLHGEDGWSTNIKTSDSSNDRKCKRLSMSAFHQYISQRRLLSTPSDFSVVPSDLELEWNPIHFSNSPSREFYATIGLMLEQNKLIFLSIINKILDP